MSHVYFGSEALRLGMLLPPAIYSLIRKYRQDFLYGNLMADAILAKKYMPAGKSSHCWDVAFRMSGSATTRSETAFCLGYLSHLAADTVAHGSLTAGCRTMEHTLLELRADRTIDNSYWTKAVSIAGQVQSRNDRFLEKSLHSVIFSVKTNRRIFKGVVALSLLNADVFPLPSFKSFSNPEKKVYLDGLQRESLDRIMDILRNGERSGVLNEDPRGRVRRRNLLNSILF